MLKTLAFSPLISSYHSIDSKYVNETHHRVFVMCISGKEKLSIYSSYLLRNKENNELKSEHMELLNSFLTFSLT